MKKIKQQNYDNLFRFEDEITVLHSQFFIESRIGNSDPIIVYKNRVWNTFINKDKEKNCLKEGLELLRSKSRYEKYASLFREYLHFLDKEFKRKFSNVPDNISKSEFVELIKRLFQFWDFYG